MLCHIDLTVCFNKFSRYYACSIAGSQKGNRQMCWLTNFKREKFHFPHSLMSELSCQWPDTEMYWVPRHLLQEAMTWPFKNFINIYKFVLVYYVGSSDFSSGWMGLTGVQIDTTAIDYLLDTSLHRCWLLLFLPLLFVRPMVIGMQAFHLFPYICFPDSRSH